MGQDAHADSVAEWLIDYLNGRGASLLTEFCHRAAVANSALLASDPSPDSAMQGSLTELIAACQSRFPGIQFYSESVSSTELGFLLSGHGEFTRDGSGQPVVTVPCSCRVELERSKIREIWFEVDDYSLLLQLGRICADPGQSVGQSAVVNHAAVDSLRKALVTRSGLSQTLGPDVTVHASIKTYKDINRGYETDSLRLDGPGKLQELLGLMHERFGEPIELLLGSGISQGYTTTFRGKIRAKVGTEMQRYDIVCGFVSPQDRVNECWIKITPPPTLLECLT
jgi:hypothetical protein